MFADMDDIFNMFCAESDEIIERMKVRAEELDKTIKEDDRK